MSFFTDALKSVRSFFKARANDIKSTVYYCTGYTKDVLYGPVGAKYSLGGTTYQYRVKPTEFVRHNQQTTLFK